MNFGAVCLTAILISLATLNANAQQEPFSYSEKKSINENPVSHKVLADSLTAYAGKMVTNITYKDDKVDSVEFFNCGNFLTVTGKSLDSLFRLVNKRKRKKENIDTLLKRAYDKEALSLEQKHCEFHILSAYLGKEVNRIWMADGVITSITIFESNKMIDLKDAELHILFEKAKEKNGFDIGPYIKKYNKYEGQLMEAWHKFY